MESRACTDCSRYRRNTVTPPPSPLSRPDLQLPALIFPVITGLAVVIMYGYCAQTAPKTSWFSIVFGMNYATYYFVCVLIVVST